MMIVQSINKNCRAAAPVQSVLLARPKDKIAGAPNRACNAGTGKASGSACSSFIFRKQSLRSLSESS